MEKSIKRPTAADTDEDLLKLQAEFQAEKASQKFKPAANLIRPQKKPQREPPEKYTESNVRGSAQVATKPPSKPRVPLTKARDFGRFNVRLEAVTEEPLQVLSDIQERFPGYFDVPDRCQPFVPEELSEESKEDGFPDVLDLSKYYIVPAGSEKPLLEASPGSSLFATEYDRLHGGAAKESTSSVLYVKQREDDGEAAAEDAMSAENERRIRSMTAEEIEKMRSEILERLDPRNIEFLRNRAKKRDEERKQGGEGAPPAKESKFKKQRREESAKATGTAPEVEQSQEEQNAQVAEAVRNLEVIGDGVLGKEELDPYSRLAMDAVHLDFATKALKSVIPRQEQNVLRLFDMLKEPPKGHDDSADALRKLARTRIDAIKELYLEEVQVGEKKTAMKFAKGVNPIVDGAWMFVPIRNVVDVVQLRGEVTEDDVDIVRLALLWSLLMMYERPSLFFSFSQPSDIYCRVAEVFLMGPEMFRDEVVSECVSRLISSFLLEKGRQGLLNFRLSKPIAALDAFMPFYDDLLRRYEEFATGDENFTLMVLIGAYMNASLSDALLMAYCLWSPDRHLVRQMTLSKEKARPILDHLAEWRKRYVLEVEEQHYQQYSQVLALYAAAVRDERVTASRNPTPFAIAASELGDFVRRHTSKVDSTGQSQERIREFDILVELIRTTVAGKIAL
ncbi:Skp1 related (ubiquitin ligase complex component) protein 18-like protein [Aphelenchoides avenae]|nr:Skp1 related (ubiquitin ligase complex component) protein 18-like protein [Aphelenchus avenae]